MNTIWRIAVQEFALFEVKWSLEAAEFIIERHETHDPGFSSERTEGSGILLEIPARLCTCFSVERFFHLLHTSGAKVECATHAYLQSFLVDWSQVGGGGELGRAGPCLYYD